MPPSVTTLKDIHAGMVKDNARRAGARDTVSSMISHNKDKVVALSSRQQEVSDGIILMQKFSEGIQGDVVSRFEDLLTSGVRQIFSKDYTVSIEFSASGNTLNADFFITLPDGKKVNLAKGEGGGLRDLIAVLQRILYLVLEPSRPAKILLMDEDLKMLDGARTPSAFSFIKELTKELGIQVIWITHSSAIVDGNDDGDMKKILIGATQ